MEETEIYLEDLKKIFKLKPLKYYTDKMDRLFNSDKDWESVKKDFIESANHDLSISWIPEKIESNDFITTQTYKHKVLDWEIRMKSRVFNMYKTIISYIPKKKVSKIK